MAQKYQQPQRGRRNNGYDEETDGGLYPSFYNPEGSDRELGDTSNIDDVLAENDAMMGSMGNDSIESSPQSRLSSAEESGRAGQGNTKGDDSEKSQVDGLYNPEGSGKSGGIRQRLSSAADNKKKAMIAGASGLFGIIMLGLSFFGLFGSFSLDAIAKNIEARSFVRFQVGMEGRSSKWVNAYVNMRMTEIETANPREKTDTLLFRSDRVDTNSPTTDWYRTLRASNFEDEVFKKNGISFTSVAYEDANGKIQVRPGVVTIDGRDSVPFELTDAERVDIDNGKDSPSFKKRLNDHMTAEVFNSDKDARKAYKKILKDNTKSYQFVKRYYTRKAIQNMTGVRDWRFFETTREGWRQSRIEMRDKFIKKALPESTRSGKFVQCLFGITTCRGTTDPADSSNHSELATTGSDGDDTDGEQERDKNGKLKNKLVSNIVSKFVGVAGAVQALDALVKVDNSLGNDAVSNGIYMARMTQAVGTATPVLIASSQAHTGQTNSEEYGEFMQIFSNAGTSEGWNKVVANNSKGTVSAAAMQESKSKEEYCSTEHQEKMLRPENKKVAESEYHWLCDQEKVGSATRAESLEKSWDNSIGIILAPISAAYNSVPIIGDAIGAFNSLLSAITGPIVNGTLSLLGLNDDLESLMTYLLEKATVFLGGAPLYGAEAPGGVIVNHVVQGMAGSAETAMRFAGGSATTETSKIETDSRVTAYLSDKRENYSLYERYADINNLDSVASKTMVTASTQSISKNISSMFSSIFQLPLTIGSTKADAAAYTGREAAAFGGIETYDMPSICTDSDPLEALYSDSLPKQTNADDLGLILASDLSWDLLEDSNAFFAKLYEDNPDASDAVMKSVYNCAVFDSMARGSTGAEFAPSNAGPNAIDNGNTADTGGSFSNSNIPDWTKLPVIDAPIGGPVSGDIKTAVANIKSGDTVTPALRILTSSNPDFITLNEIGETSLAKLESDAPGYGAYREKEIDGGPGGGQRSLDNAILWKKDKWKLLQSGRMKITEDDMGYISGRPFVWDRWAIWGIFQRNDGAIVPVITTHMMTNPAKFPNQHGNPPVSRIKQYSESMDILLQLTALLAQHGPVLIGGDMNSQADQGDWSAVPKFKAAGFDYSNDNAVIYLFRPEATKLVNNSIVEVGSDHKAIVTTVNMNGVGPGAIKNVPTGSPNGNGTTPSDGFAWPIDKSQYVPLSNCYRKPGHTGIDIPVSNQPVRASASGVVSQVGGPGGDSGNYIIIKHPSGKWTNYQHLSIKRVQDGQSVSQGDVIGISGNTGYSTGPHLHFSITTLEGLDSRTVVSYSLNPLDFLPNDRPTGSCQ